MRNHKQILMKSEIFFKEPPMVCMSQECGGILIFLANSPLKFAWIIGIYGKPIFWTLGISKNPLTPSKYRFPPLHPISAPVYIVSVGQVGACVNLISVGRLYVISNCLIFKMRTFAQIIFSKTAPTMIWVQKSDAGVGIGTLIGDRDYIARK